MLELAARDEHEWKFAIRFLCSGDDVGRNELSPSRSRGKSVDEHDGLSGIAFFFARVGHAALRFEPFPRDPCNRRHCLAHLIEDVARSGVIPIEAKAACELLNDPEIVSCFSGRLQRFASKLHHTIGVW
jgi:hypothetical protein